MSASRSSPPDRRGIDDQGRLPKQRFQFSSLKDPGGLLHLYIKEMAKITELLSSLRRDVTIGKLPRSFSFGSSMNRPEVDLSIPDGRIGAIKGEIAWQLKEGSEQDSWARLERTIYAIVVRTPAKEYEFTPCVVVEAYRLGESPEKSKPTVLIDCNSWKFAAQLEKTLRRTGVLKTAEVPFRVVIRDPEDEADVWSSNAMTTPPSSTFTSSARDLPV